MLAAATLAAVTSGFALGLASILSIGPQNLHLIERGLARDFPWTTAVVGLACEIPLVICGVVGAQAGVGHHLALQPIQFAAAAFLAICGLRTLRRTVAADLTSAGGELASRGRAVVAMLGVTLLNPLVYVEIVLVTGVFASAHGPSSGLFGIGFLAASAIRFFGLSALGALLACWLRDAATQRAARRLSGLLLIGLAASQAFAAA